MPDKLTDLYQTCEACPSQWQGRVGDDYVYIRYRWGWLSWGRGRTLDDAVNGVEEYDDVQLGGEYDGVLGTADMLTHIPWRPDAQ